MKTKLPAFVLKFGAKSKLRGRSVRVWKKKDHADAPWYIGPEWRGVRYRACLNTANRIEAELKAEELCYLVWNDRGAEFRAKLKGGNCGSQSRGPEEKDVATVEEVLQLYPVVAVPAYQRAATAQANGNALRRLVRDVLADGHNGEAARPVRCDALTGAVLAQFEQSRLASVPEADRAKRQSVLTSINADVRAVRSIFQPRLVELYRARGLHLPDMGSFMSRAMLKSKVQKKAKPTRELLMKTFEAAGRLRSTAPEIYMAWLLAVYSLRRAEIQRAERSWLRLETLNDDFDFVALGMEQWVIRTDLGKSDRERQIPVPESVAREIISFWERDCARRPEWDRKFILPSHANHAGGKSRAEGVVRAATQWMRELGWTTRKALHEMRALFGRRVRARHGLDAARELMGHQDERTTENNYTGGKSLRDVVIELPELGIQRKDAEAQS